MARLGDWPRRFRAQVREVRGLGLLFGIELRGKVAPVLKALQARGVLALPAGLNVLRLLPPLVIAQADLEQVALAIESVFEELGAAALE